MDEFIAKIEKLFALQKVKVTDFRKLIGEWGDLIAKECYHKRDKHQTFLKLNHIKLSIKWYIEQCCSDKSKQLKDFLEYMIKYLGIELESLSMHITIRQETSKTDEVQTENMRWTKNKRSLIELISALHEAQCINDGSITLQKLVVHFEALFGIDLKNYHSELNKMAARKPQNDSYQRAYFLRGLVDNFNNKVLKI